MKNQPLNMNCLVVDDEPLARKLLEDYIQNVNGLELVKSCSNAIETFKILQTKHIDLLFLDIQMPQVTGIELLKSLRNTPHVILTTAYRNYALEAFDLDVVDYLLKPISFDRFLRAIGKVFQIKGVPPTDASESLSGSGNDDVHIYFKVKREMKKVYLNDIIYIESRRDYVMVKTMGKEFIAHQRISYLEQRLPENEFIRIHRSFMIPLSRITSYNTNSIHLDDIEVPIGRKYKSETLKALQKCDPTGG